MCVLDSGGRDATDRDTPLQRTTPVAPYGQVISASTGQIRIGSTLQAQTSSFDSQYSPNPA